MAGRLPNLPAIQFCYSDLDVDHRFGHSEGEKILARAFANFAPLRLCEKPDCVDEFLAKAQSSRRFCPRLCNFRQLAETAIKALSRGIFAIRNPQSAISDSSVIL
jgi:hypothetical protein